MVYVLSPPPGNTPTLFDGNVPQGDKTVVDWTLGDHHRLLRRVHFMQSTSPGGIAAASGRRQQPRHLADA